MNNNRMLARCLTCQSDNWVSDAGLKPLWVIAAEGIRLGRIAETRPPDPCWRCGETRFQYRADFAYVDMAYQALLRDRRFAYQLTEPVDRIWAAYKRTLDPLTPS